MVRVRRAGVVMAVAVTVLAGACTPAPAPTRPVRVLVVGDSTGVFLTFALANWNASRRSLDVASASLMGCGMVVVGTEFAAGVERPFDRTCGGWPFLWAAQIARFRPQVIVVASGFHDMTDRRLRPDGPWQHVGQQPYDDALRFHLEFAARVMERSSAQVLWLDTPPFAERQVAPGGADVHPMNDPVRAARFNELLRETAARHPRQRVVSLAGYLASMPGGVMNTVARPDGMHVDGPGAIWVADWLAGQVRAVAPRR